MDSSKVYKNIIYTLFNIYKNEKLRTILFFDEDYKEYAIGLINCLLWLEFENKETFNEQKWSKIFAKTLVNITSTKIKFEKPDNYDLEKVYENYSFILTYSLNTLGVSKEELSKEDFSFNEDEVTSFKNVSDEMKKKYGEGFNTTKNDNFSSDSSKADTINGSTTSESFDPNKVLNQDEIPIPPLQDKRFYPYKTKPKYIKYFRYTITTLVALTTLFISIIIIIMSTKSFTIGIGELGDAILRTNANSNKLGQTINLSFDVLSPSVNANQLIFMTGVNPFSIISIIFIITLVLYLAYSISQKNKIYRERYRVPTFKSIFLIFILGMFTYQSMKLIIFYNDINGSAYNWHDTLIKYIYAKNEIEVSSKELADFNSYTDLWKELKNNIISKTSLDKVIPLSWISVVLFIVTIITIITSIILNPRIDREKIDRANTEYHNKITAMMQGKSYEMDKSLYDDIDNEEKKLKEKKRKDDEED